MACQRDEYQKKYERLHTLLIATVKRMCPLCEKGFPLQENQIWHNDLSGKDTLVNNECKSIELRKELKKERNV